MPSIYVDPEALHNHSRMMEHYVHLMLEEESRLKLEIARLELAWQGGNSSDFILDMQNLQRRLHENIGEFYLLALRLAHRSAEWEESDQIWQALYRDLYTNFPVAEVK